MGDNGYTYFKNIFFYKSNLNLLQNNIFEENYEENGLSILFLYFFKKQHAFLILYSKNEYFF